MNSKAIKRQLLAAIAMVLVATIALGSSTYAWFAAQNDVKAEGMMLQAQGESGIVIKSVENTSSKFASIASAGMTSTDESMLKPTSTTDLVTWYHARSDIQDDAKAKQDKNKYETLVSTEGYVLKRSFIIRSAADSVPVTGVKLAVSNVSVTSTTTDSQNLDKALRIGVKVANQFFIYNPAAQATSTVTMTYGDGKGSVSWLNAAEKTRDLFTLSNNTIPANDTELAAEIYMWFEGEDENCKSTNITASLDKLQVSVTFESVAIE